MDRAADHASLCAVFCAPYPGSVDSTAAVDYRRTPGLPKAESGSVAAGCLHRAYGSLNLPPRPVPAVVGWEFIVGASLE